MHGVRDNVEVGVIAYGPNFQVLFLRAAEFVEDKILGGAGTGDIPLKEPIKFDLVVDLKTAPEGPASASARRTVA